MAAACLRATGLGVATALGALVALFLFWLMHVLVQPPAEPRRPARRLAIEGPDLVRVRPASRTPRAIPPPQAGHPRASAAKPRPVPLRVARPRLALAPGRARAGSGLPLAWSAALPVRERAFHWEPALREYLRMQTEAKRPYRPPVFPRRPPPPSALPGRMRLPDGGELDRIGAHCYAAPGNLVAEPEASPTPVLARVMRAMQSLFAHEVPCGPGGKISMQDDFLEKLHKLRFTPPAPRT